jgi:hypothetical protein
MNGLGELPPQRTQVARMGWCAPRFTTLALAGHAGFRPTQ